MLPEAGRFVRGDTDVEPLPDAGRFVRVDTVSELDVVETETRVADVVTLTDVLGAVRPDVETAEPILAEVCEEAGCAALAPAVTPAELPVTPTAVEACAGATGPLTVTAPVTCVAGAGDFEVLAPAGAGTDRVGEAGFPATVTAGAGTDRVGAAGFTVTETPAAGARVVGMAAFAAVVGADVVAAVTPTAGTGDCFPAGTVTDPDVDTSPAANAVLPVSKGAATPMVIAIHREDTGTTPERDNINSRRRRTARTREVEKQLLTAIVSYLPCRRCAPNRSRANN